MGHRSDIVKSQCSFGSVFKADQIARDICRGVERGQFQINHGFDGFLLGTMTIGMAPVYHLADGIAQVLHEQSHAQLPCHRKEKEK